MQQINVRLGSKESNIRNNTNQGQCSRCGECCGLFIPLTLKEIEEVREYVSKHNIQPENRVDILTGSFEARCCFYNKKEKKCNIYEARPYVCRDFKCDHKDWRTRRDRYEKRAKYNSFYTKELATFDDLIYEDYAPILRYIFSFPNAQDPKTLVSILHMVNRLDLLGQFKAFDENGNEVSGEELLKMLKE